MPHVTVFDLEVIESAGSVIVPFQRTGGDLSFETKISASTRSVASGMFC